MTLQHRSQARTSKYLMRRNDLITYYCRKTLRHNDFLRILRTGYLLLRFLLARLMHALPLPCRPLATHPHHACPLPRTPPAMPHCHAHPPSWTEWVTHASENITLPLTSFAGGKKFPFNSKGNNTTYNTLFNMCKILILNTTYYLIQCSHHRTCSSNKIV